MALVGGVNKGFTLVEILVAMLVFSIVSVLGYQAMNAVFEVEQREADSYAEAMQIQAVWAILLNDFMHLRARPARDERGDKQRAYEVPAEIYLVRFTRGGLPPLASIPGGLQRVAYDVSPEGELRRWTWAVVDQPDGSEPIEQVLLRRVKSLEVEQLDEHNFFVPYWPPLDSPNMPLNFTPKMIRLALVMNNGDELERLIPGVEQP